MISWDLLAATNAAFGALLLRHFCGGYEQTSESSPPMPLMYIPLPLVLTERVSRTLMARRTDGSIYQWLEDNEELRLELRHLIPGTLDFTRRSLVFGHRHQILDVSLASVAATKTSGMANAKWNLTDARGRATRNAHLLGFWMGKAGPLSQILTSLEA